MAQHYLSIMNPNMCIHGLLTSLMTRLTLRLDDTVEAWIPQTKPRRQRRLYFYKVGLRSRIQSLPEVLLVSETMTGCTAICALTPPSKIVVSALKKVTWD